MNFLDICRLTIDHLDRDGDSLVTTDLSVVKDIMHRKTILAVRKEYSELQNKCNTWTFSWKSDKLFSTSIGMTDYIVDTGLWSVRKLIENSVKCFNPTSLTFSTLSILPYNSWINMFSRNLVSFGTPLYITELPSGKFRLYPTPMQLYDIKADWFSQNHWLVLDTDEPIWHVDDHSILAWLALKNLVEFFDAGELNMSTAQTVKAKMEAFNNRYTMSTTNAGSLA